MKKVMLVYFAIFSLTFLDIVLTLIGLHLGVIEEANPLMNYFFDLSITLSVIGVLLYVGIVMFVLYKLNSRISWLYNALIGLTLVKVG